MKKFNQMSLVELRKELGNVWDAMKHAKEDSPKDTEEYVEYLLKKEQEIVSAMVGK